MEFVIYKKLKCMLIIFLSTFLLLSSPCFSAQVVRSSKQKKQGWLFVQSATSGSLKKIKGDPKHYRLTLKGISPSMVAFTDRPARKGCIRTVGAFVNRWKTYTGKGNYQKNPPNASLVLSSNGVENVLVVCLRNPEYHKKNQTLSYKIRLIELIKNHKRKNLQIPARIAIPKKFQQVVLFIDDSWSSLGG